MKKIYNSLRLCLFALLAGQVPAHAQSTTFNYTGAPVTWTVPTGVVAIQVDMEGATGGQNSWGFGGPPFCIDSAGHGARLQATLAVTCGDVLTIYVGGAGGIGITGSAPTPGGYNGGGTADYAPTAGITPNIAGGGGGGASDLRTGAAGLTDRVLVAGGGGGAGGNSCWTFAWPGTFNQDKGGDGGGTTAEDGWDNGSLGGILAGLGGSTTWGTGGISAGPGYGPGTNGALGIGGDGGSGTAGGGGGGGYYGGGGGCWAGGGGGSSYADPTLASSVTHTRGANSAGDGYVIINEINGTAGTIVGSTNGCLGGVGTYTDPTATPGGTWSSSFPSIGSIDPVTGVASYLAVGVFDITYTVTTPCTTFSTTLFSVSVNPAPNPITGGRFEICQYDPDTLFDATPGGSWTSVTPGVLAIDPVTGELSSGGSAGVATISYYTGVGCPALATVTVDQLPLPIAGPNYVCEGGTVTFIDGYPGGTWSTNYAPAGTIDVSGNFTAATGTSISGTTTQIVYTTAFGCFMSHPVTIDTTGAAITGPMQTCLGDNILLTNTVGGGAWTSSVTGVATIGSTGLVISVSSGVTTISYTTPGCQPAMADVTVNPLPAPIIGSTAICPGYITTLTDASPGGSWLSSDSRVAISSTGDVTSSFPGIPPVTIYYTLPTTCFTTITVNVTNAPSVINGPDSLCQGLTGTMSATPPSGSTAGVWSSTSLSIAPIDTATGAITALSAGTVNISYTLPSGCYALKSFLVENPALDAVTVAATPAGPVCSGDVVTLVATSINGGAAPAFTWKKFSTPIPGATSNTLVVTPTHGDVINIFMTPDNTACVQYSVVADSFFMNVYPDTMQPLVNINTPDPVSISMLGQTVAFFSNVTWGGTDAKYQWYVNNAAAPGATNSSFSLTIYAPDTVYCSVTGNAPCPATIVVPGVSNSIVIGDVLGVKPLANGGDNLAVIPNPSSGSFVLSGTLANTAVDEVTYDISNMLGQVICSGTAKPVNGKLTQQIKLANAPDGTYLLKVNTGAGVQSFHIVVAR